MSDVNSGPRSDPISMVEFRVGDGEDLSRAVYHLQWESFVNRGYTIKVVVLDPNYNLLKSTVNGSGGDVNQIKYLKEGRKKIVTVRFKLKKGDQETEEQVAYLTDMQSTGVGVGARTIFIGIDPLSFLLSRGKSKGNYYDGSVSDVIKQVVTEYSSQPNGPGATVNVSKTEDNDKNRWFTYRQDPKTFIKSLLDWSSSVTKGKSRWIVSSGWDAENDRPKINIKEEVELDRKQIGTYTIFTNDQNPRQFKDWFLSMNNFTSAFQTRMTTSGISSVSGRYIDQISLKDKSTVDDETTGSKLNVDYGNKELGAGSDKAFTKPDDVDWGTYVTAIPEQNDGGVGKNYEDYIDGRARQKFMNLLGVSMNLMVDVIGEPRLFNSEQLGAIWCVLKWMDADADFYFLHGKWLINGFQHYYNRDDGWRTKIMLYRIDWNANATKI